LWVACIEIKKNLSLFWLMLVTLSSLLLTSIIKMLPNYRGGKCYMLMQIMQLRPNFSVFRKARYNRKIHLHW